MIHFVTWVKFLWTKITSIGKKIHPIFKIKLIRIILAFIVLSIKYNEDDYFANDFYSKVGGLSLQEINVLEYESLILLKHNLFVEDDFFSKYKIYLDQYSK